MALEADRREGEFGEGLCDADDSFELADGNGDGGAGGGGELGSVDLATDGNEVGGEFFTSFRREARGTTPGSFH